MRMPPKKYLIGAAALALLGAGVAEAATARLHTMNVEAPDGSVVQVQYTGDVAPRVQVVPADAMTPADMQLMGDPFAHMDRISAMMDAQMNVMMQRAALMQQQVGADGSAAGAPGLTAASDAPQGMHMTYYSTSTDASGCTRSVSYSSDGSGEAPKMTQVASDGCDAAKPGNQAIPAKSEVQVAQPASQEPLGPKV
ncbi:hypothetical protein V474_23905 [Novosphingobium barchaimii LL02]|uniref:Uncharacterized protein n=1 Tax=Novosphingobium barchaimii LL02 TaxID=1114963 RepID=A0A0J7XNE0_9SPHN|nr:hypothetical protein [Novosphingobium barchaimii]KMS52603.1 hypothetical protein V474_23905 [Novosphingobium barchaimii LL02]